MSRKSQLLALARSGGAAAVRAQGPTLWPDVVFYNDNPYRLEQVKDGRGYYSWTAPGTSPDRFRCVALSLADAQAQAVR